MLKKTITTLVVGTALGIFGVTGGYADDPPAPGVSTLADSIRQSGKLRVGFLAEPPWLKENTTGVGAQYSGPSWIFAEAIAEDLGVTIEVVQVSNDTKVSILATGQVDITIAPLSVTPERQQVVDFVTYTNTALCLFGKADNPKLQGVTAVDQLNSPDITITFYTGTPPETWLPTRLPNATLRAVVGSGAGAPVDEIMAGRADVATIDSVAFFMLEKQVEGLVSIPPGRDCLNSVELATPVGVAIDKGHPEFLAYLQSVADEMNDELVNEQLRVIDEL